MTDWSEKYNDLPMEVREIASKVMLQHEIRDMYAEKERLKRRYEQSRKEINEKIKYCEHELNK